MMENSRFFVVVFAFVAAFLECSFAQQSGSFNFAKKTTGEREGELTSSAIAGVSIACIAGLAGLFVTILFCYYVYKQQQPREQYNHNFVPVMKA